MKKNVLIVCSILLIIIIICTTFISINGKKLVVVKQENKEYEQYQKQEIYGTEVITLINKAIDHNQKNNVQTDETGKYIDNETNSIIIDVMMITNEEKNQTTTYRMETINKVGIGEFIANFNTAKFKITNIQYHKQTGKIKYIEITQK